MKIKDDVLDIIKLSTTEENILYLPLRQLDRKLYVEVNKCLESIGGSWNKKQKGHLFESDPSDLLDEMINIGEWVNKKKEFQFFETPIELAQRLVEMADIKPIEKALEPEAGRGRILKFLLEKTNYVSAVELEKSNFDYLCENFKTINIWNKDFLEIDNEKSFDKIVMNPPFTKHQDIKHIFKAWNFVKNGGRLISIVSESPFFREDNLSKEFRQWLNDNNAEIINLDSGEFKEAGTMVKTRIIVVDKYE